MPLRPVSVRPSGLHSRGALGRCFDRWHVGSVDCAGGDAGEGQGPYGWNQGRDRHAPHGNDELQERIREFSAVRERHSSD